jgi:hypothetical protein
VQHRDLLLGGEAAEEVIGPLTERDGRIAEANRFDDDPPSSLWQVVRSLAILLASCWHPAGIRL